MALRLIMLGDIVGEPGMRAVRQLMPEIRRRWQPHVVLANAENAHQGSGFTSTLYKELMDAGIDAVTLGDHVFKRMQVANLLETAANVIRPLNLPRSAIGRGCMEIPVRRPNAAPVNLYVITVLGRIFMSMYGDDPFFAVDEALSRLPAVNPIVLVEIHAEATSEKKAMGWHLNGKVAAVVGTHTHVATADAEVLSGGTAYITDLGMCGPHESVLGRRIDRVLTHMTTSMPAPFDVAPGDPRVNGVCIDIDESTARATRIERLELKADATKPPFVRPTPAD